MLLEEIGSMTVRLLILSIVLFFLSLTTLVTAMLARRTTLENLSTVGVTLRCVHRVCLDGACVQLNRARLSGQCVYKISTMPNRTVVLNITPLRGYLLDPKGAK